jgi:hypothetical protein
MVVTSGNTLYTEGNFFFSNLFPDHPHEDPQSRLERIRKGLLRCAHASCWRWGEESAAMWRLYCGTTDGIAAQTTFARLRDSIVDADVCVTLVKYLHYRTQRFTIHEQPYHPAMHKQRAFEHEQEVRVLSVPGGRLQPR